MTTHKINDREYIFLEVPTGATNYRLKYEDVLHKKVLYFDLGGLTFNQFVTGVPDFDILGIASELTEEQILELIEYWDTPTGGDDYQDYYKNYEAEPDDDYPLPIDFTEPISSLNSLITSKGLNPERTLIIERKK